MFILIFSTSFVWNTSLSKKILAICYINVRRSSCKLPIILLIFKSNFSQQAAQKSWTTKYHKNPSTVKPICCQADRRETDWRTNRHDDANIRVSQFCDKT